MCFTIPTLDGIRDLFSMRTGVVDKIAVVNPNWPVRAIDESSLIHLRNTRNANICLLDLQFSPKAAIRSSVKRHDGSDYHQDQKE